METFKQEIDKKILTCEMERWAWFLVFCWVCRSDEENISWEVVI